MKKTKTSELVMHGVFLIAACASVLAVILICVFLFANGLPAIKEIGFFKFIFGKTWRASNGEYGIFPMILGSLYVTAGAIIVGVPIGILTAIFLAEFCPEKPYKILKPAIDLLAGIPSIIYGYFGLRIIVPTVRDVFKGLGMQTDGNCILTASLVLGIMILPTIIGVCETAIRAVPRNYYEGSLALGADHERSVFFIQFPAARSGVLAGVVLGIGRAVGETMAVVMVAGNQARVPTSALQGVRTLTANIVQEMGYATGLSRQALIATGVVLFVFVLLINLLFSALRSKGMQNN